MMTEGPYWGHPVSGVCSEAKNAKSEQFVVTLSVTHEPVNGKWSELSPPVERRMYVSLTDDAWPYAQAKLDALGFNGAFHAPVFDCPEGVELVCEHEEYQGKTKERWGPANWGGGAQPEPISEERARKLTAKWKASHAAKPSTGAPATPPVPVPAEVAADTYPS